MPYATCVLPHGIGLPVLKVPEPVLDGSTMEAEDVCGPEPSTSYDPEFDLCNIATQNHI